MIGRARDFEEFFSGKAAIKEIYKQFSHIYSIIFNHGEIILYMLQDYEIVEHPHKVIYNQYLRKNVNKLIQ
jgi:hypothetical protein